MESNKTYTEEEMKEFAIFYAKDNLYQVGIAFKTWKASREPKKEKPLFVTEDGVEIFNGDSWWYVSDDFSCTEHHLANHKIVPFGKAFSTREKAEEYIMENKPCLSYKDISVAGNYIAGGNLLINSGHLKGIINKKLNHGGAGDCA